VTSALLGLGWLSLGLSGCASEGEALEKRLAKLQEEVTRVQSQNDRTAERLDAIELRQATAARPEERVASVAPATVSRPKLKVVKVESDGEVPESVVDGAPLDDSGPRVIIQGEGKTLETRSLPGAAKPSPKAEAKSESTKKAEPSKAAPK
jgi:hypothetical protein